MPEPLTVFTVIPPIYRNYEEFHLCLSMFRKALPESARMIAAEYETVHLGKLVREHLDQAGPYVLIAREPAVIMDSACVEELLNVMTDHPDIACLLPSDVRGYRQGKAAAYYTMRGFERFSRHLRSQERLFIPYDGRDPWIFLARKETLQALTVPDDPMEIPRMLEGGKVRISLNAYIHPFVDYDLTTARTEILPLIPEHISSLLDIGCYTGMFGALVREKRRCRVVGSEINPDAAARALENLDAVVTGDIMKADIAETFDCISCLDVIEHITETGQFLERIRGLLNESGYLLLSVPNVGHWSVVEDLLAGRWDYIPAGTLCVTHLRFFTRKTIGEALAEAGFRVLMVKENVPPLQDDAGPVFEAVRSHGVEVDEKSLLSLGYYILSQKTDHGGARREE